MIQLFIYGIMLLGAGVFVYYRFFRSFPSDKFVLANRINPPAVVKEGDFLFDGAVCTARFRWRTMRYPLNQIERICTNEIGNAATGKRHPDIEIMFEDGSLILLNGCQEAHIEMAAAILSRFGKSLPLASGETGKKEALHYKAPTRFS